jgi:hypothetical protein
MTTLRFWPATSLWALISSQQASYELVVPEDLAGLRGGTGAAGWTDRLQEE